jgi:hypothetical protein
MLRLVTRRTLIGFDLFPCLPEHVAAPHFVIQMSDVKHSFPWELRLSVRRDKPAWSRGCKSLTSRE